ncbi:hypothetical protein [Dysgonomonas sp. ZJ279]|uniref:hypothetical protein n=1 Tax=Dysgonomonas sp. ZJ279 TaxID=2709796 RepID=UPI0013EE0F79|nr:hypothetical protein [Dysgonomonas sp. ZJ279]
MKRFPISKNARNALFVLLMAFSAFLAFEPLFENLGQKAAQEFAAAIFGTIFAAVITMVLLTKQTETEQEKDRNDKVFEQKILLYNQVIDTLQTIFEKTEDGSLKITRKEIMQIEFLLAKMMMIGSDKTIYEFKSFYETVTNNYSSDTGIVNLSSSDKQIVFRFADYCREELGLSTKNIEKDILEDIILQSELLSTMQQVDDIDANAIETIKDIYGYLVFDLNIRNQNVSFTSNGFKAYINKKQTDDGCFLKCVIDRDQVYLVLNKEYKTKEFEKGNLDNEPAIILKSSDRKNIELHFPVIEKLIKESLKETIV